MSRARTVLGLVVFALASGAALSPTHADPAPSFSGLHAATLPAMPDALAAPDEIPAEAHIEGMSLRRQPSHFGRARGGFSMDRKKGWCMVESPGSDLLPGRGEASISRAKGVVAMRMERLDAQPGTQAVLEVQDVWIDAATLGVRVASTARVPLARLAGGPGGFVVYGFRDGRSAHVVVPATGTMAFRDASGQTGVTSCGHVRLPLVAEPRSGSMALVMGTVSFPLSARAIAKRAALVSPTNPPAEPATPQAMPPHAPEPVLTETRVVRVSASLSQTSQEREPVFSVALGWEEAEQPPQPPAMRLAPPPSRIPPPAPASTRPPITHPAQREIDFEGD